MNRSDAVGSGSFVSRSQQLWIYRIAAIAVKGLFEAMEKEEMDQQENVGEKPPINNDSVGSHAINKEAARDLKQRRRNHHSSEFYTRGILKGDRTVLAQAITLIESSRKEQMEVARRIIEHCLPFSGNSLRIGISGVPGVGKSTFIESLGMKLAGAGRKPAVLTVDPSSERSGGSIMGDKIRMETLANCENVFVRPSPSGNTLGGVTRHTREITILCEAAGFDTIFIETLGVGQSETAVHGMVDFFLLLMLAGAGDELQGMKRGIMERADAIIINKADGNNLRNAEIARNAYQNALHLFPLPESGWKPRVLTCSAQNHEGIDQVWEMILEYMHLTQKNGYFSKNRRNQRKYWMHETIDQLLKEYFYQTDAMKEQLKMYEKKVREGKMSSYLAARDLLAFFHK